MPKRWLPGDECEVRIGDGWVPGEITRLYKHFAEVEFEIISIQKTTRSVKSYAQIREPQ